MELGDLNANFTIEVDSQVIDTYSSVKISVFFTSPCLLLLWFCLPTLPQVFNWTYFTANIMDTVNISIPETEKIMIYAPNYFRRLNHTLAKYTKRSVFNVNRWLFFVKH